jgi:hypothetical protein
MVILEVERGFAGVEGALEHRLLSRAAGKSLVLGYSFVYDGNRGNEEIGNAWTRSIGSLLSTGWDLTGEDTPLRSTRGTSCMSVATARPV